jgi:SnoaL-like domain
MSIPIEDERAILHLYARAIHVFDRGDPSWVDFWEEGGEFRFAGDPAAGIPEIRLNTRDMLAGMVEQAFALTQGRGLHHFSNFAFEPEGEGVRVRAYLMLMVNGETLMEPSIIRQNTRIDDLVVKTDRGWLFRSRSVGAT